MFVSQGLYAFPKSWRKLLTSYIRNSGFKWKIWKGLEIKTTTNRCCKMNWSTPCFAEYDDSYGKICHNFMLYKKWLERTNLFLVNFHVWETDLEFPLVAIWLVPTTGSNGVEYSIYGTRYDTRIDICAQHGVSFPWIGKNIS